MALERTSVRMQKEMLEMREEGHSIRTIARCLEVSRETVRKVFAREDQGLPIAQASSHNEKYDVFDWEYINKEVSVRGVPVKILWEEQTKKHEFEVTYKVFWKEFRRRYPKTKEATVKRVYTAGEITEVDFCTGIPIHGKNGTKKTSLFVMSLPFSSYVYAEFIPSQKIPDFIGAQDRGFRAMGGVTSFVVTDNHKAAVTKAHRYEPQINETYEEYASYMGFRVIAARPSRPKDKANVERQIGVIQKQFYPKVRDQVFKSLSELNKALHEHMEVFLHSEMKSLGISRHTRFENEKKSLQDIPRERFCIPEYKSAKVDSTCHIDFHRNSYSVPHSYVGFQVKVRATNSLVEVFAKDGTNIAAHSRLKGRGNCSTVKGHYPSQKLAYESVDVERILEEALKVGPKTLEVVKINLDMDHPFNHLRRVQGILSLHKVNKKTGNRMHEKEAMEYAASQCLQYKKYTLKYFSVCVKHYTNHLRSDVREKTPKRDSETVHLGDHVLIP